MWLSRSSARATVLQPEHLLDDLAGRQIALDAVQAAGAEDAAHAAADLRADANRPPVLVAHQHALDLSAIGEPSRSFSVPSSARV